MWVKEYFLLTSPPPGWANTIDLPSNLHPTKEYFKQRIWSKYCYELSMNRHTLEKYLFVVYRSYGWASVLVRFSLSMVWSDTAGSKLQCLQCCWVQPGGCFQHQVRMPQDLLAMCQDLLKGLYNWLEHGSQTRVTSEPSLKCNWIARDLILVDAVKIHCDGKFYNWW